MQLVYRYILDLTQLSRRARWAAPHLARRCESLTTIVGDGTNVTDENVTALLAASQGTLQRLSLADCRHLRNLWYIAPQQTSPSCSRLAEVNLRGSSWSPAALTSLLRAARHSLTALNLSSTCVSHASLKNGDDFGEVARCILACRGGAVCKSNAQVECTS
jgi:Uri superfamily endonuclease